MLMEILQNLEFQYNYPLSVSQFESLSFKIYPNPVSNQLFIQSPASESYDLELINTLGQVILVSR